jgi:dienelactone hydrolase
MRRLIFALLTCITPTLLHAQASRGDEWLKKPVDQTTFDAFLDFFVYDSNVPFQAVVGEPLERDGIVRETITFQSTPGVRVSAYHYRVNTPGWERRPTIIFIHGGVPAGKSSLDPLAMQSVRGGLNVFAIDMLYFGARKTDLLTEFTEQTKHERLYNQPAAHLAWVTQTVKDVGRSFDYLVAERGADARHIGLLGFSRGGQQALIAGGADKRLKAVGVLYSGHFDRSETGHRAAACPANYIGRIAPRPLFLLNGEFDSDYVKDTSVLPLHKHAQSPKHVTWVETGHQAPTAEAFSHVVTWLRANL